MNFEQSLRDQARTTKDITTKWSRPSQPLTQPPTPAQTRPPPFQGNALSVLLDLKGSDVAPRQRTAQQPKCRRNSRRILPPCEACLSPLARFLTSLATHRQESTR